MKGPVARAGFILSRSRVRGTRVPNTVANITTANSEAATANDTVYFVVPGCVKKMYKNTTDEMTTAFIIATRHSRPICDAAFFMSRRPLARP
jgi:hypothetical protein